MSSFLPKISGAGAPPLDCKRHSKENAGNKLFSIPELSDANSSDAAVLIMRPWRFTSSSKSKMSMQQTLLEIIKRKWSFTRDRSHNRSRHKYSFADYNTVLPLLTVCLGTVQREILYGKRSKINKLTSVFHASVLLLNRAAVG